MLTEPAVAPLRPRVSRAGLRPLSAPVAIASLVSLAALSVVLRLVLARQVLSPFVFMDELVYQRMAYSFAHAGKFSLFGNEGAAYSPLYPIIISPVYAVTSSAQVAYEWVKAVNVVILSLSVFPIYGLGRSVLSRPRAIGAAALSLLLPLMFYANLEMTESLAYPLFLCATWATLQAVRRPQLRTDLLLMATIILSAAARLQSIALLPAALMAIALVPLVRPPLAQGRFAALRLAIKQHWLLYGVSAGFAVFVLAKQALNGGTLPLAGQYAGVATSHPSLLRMAEATFHHFAELDLALGAIPFAGAILALIALIKFGFPTRQLEFGAVAACVAAWLLLEVGYDAAAFDNPGSAVNAARIHERYLIYLMPLFMIAFVAGLRATRPRVSTMAHLVVAAVAALLPAALPFHQMVNFTVPFDAFGLEVFATTVHGTVGPIPHPALVAVCISAFFALAYLYALLRPRPSFAVVMSVFMLVMVSMLVQLRMRVTTEAVTNDVQSQSAWVDAVTKGGNVKLVGDAPTDSAALLLTAYHNFTVNRAYTVCAPLFGTAFGEHRIRVGPNGVLFYGSAPIRASYVVAPVRLALRGRIVARQARDGLELIMPQGGLLRLERALPPCASA